MKDSLNQQNAVATTDLFGIPVAEELKGKWNEKMPCGHLRQYGTLGEVLPVHCLACENAKLREFVAQVAKDTYCDGPGCPYCESGDDHPITWLSAQALDILPNNPALTPASHAPDGPRR
jgi:hypothetical protein